ncbi:hypothetical protein C8D76_10786 [Pasteurella langaaensis DSM 22999]|uniref:Uncharacterized protein n=1 Tax=Alitibacter langaaensis DSM 22999 TaxID=1122935 RepID=A0A2U0T5K1_9PAST|nr:hypothetical protein C8D76_10786 [Pasteurella langaaensis DSM 22999]
MQRLGLQGKGKQKKYRSYQGEVGKITANLLQLCGRQTLVIGD